MCATNIWNTWSTDFRLEERALSTTKVFTKAFCEWSERGLVGGVRVILSGVRESAGGSGIDFRSLERE